MKNIIVVIYFSVCTTRLYIPNIIWTPVQPGALSQAMAESRDYGT